MHNSPHDPKVTRPVLACTIIFVSVLGIVISLFHLNFLLTVFSSFLLVVGIVSYTIFASLVRPIRKKRIPTSDFTKHRWTSRESFTVVRFERWVDKPAPLVIAIHGWQSDSSSSESSQSLVPHSLDCELGSTDQNPQIGDLVVVYLRCTGRGRKRRQVTRTGIVKEIDSRDPQRVKTDTCSRKFRKVLEICQRRSTSMISNDTESQSEYSISQYY